MKKQITAFTLYLLTSSFAYTQGCMAVRQIAGFGLYDKVDNSEVDSKWFLNINNRYFKSFRTYRGSEDLKTPKKDQVINKTFTTDFTVLKLLTNGWSLAINVPFISNSRSTTFEHGGIRHATRSFGLGDVRVTAYKWIWKPGGTRRGNIQIGFGVKLPTGDFKYQDHYYKNDSTTILNPVDQSIQLGDGGTGLIVETNSFYNLSNSVALYANLFYLSNPREHNGVTTAKNAPVTALAIKAGADIMSVPDQYTVRGGAAFRLKKLNVETGIRAEGVPVNDLIGGKGGLRRAGYNISAELGLSYKFKKTVLYTYFPVSLKRKISQSVTDKNISSITGVHTISPGGFADYLLFFGVSIKL